MIRAEYEMRKQDISQTELSERTGINRVSVNMLMRGKTHAWPNWQTRIAAALGWEGDPAELFQEIEVK